VGVLTGGGDCAGLNAVIRAVVRSAHSLGWEAVGLHESFGGLLDIRKSRVLRLADVRGILHTGGTILGTTNHGDPFNFPKRGGRDVAYVDRSAEVVANFEKLRLDGLIVIGGDGTLRIGLRFHELGVPVVGVPKTIDNDVAATAVTFGFDSAVSVATDALDRLHTTAFSHRRVMVLETMGRNVGWIALHAGIAGGADVILIPEIPFDIDKVCHKIRDRARRGRRFSIVVAAEGAAPLGGVPEFREQAKIGFEGRLGGIGEIVAEHISRLTGAETRSLVLGHLQRGGRPTTWDRLLGTRFGSAAMRAAAEGRWGQMVALRPPTIQLVPLARAVSQLKRVPKSSDVVRAARDLGIAFGD
jgi:6-phosphofructokinase 1